MGLKIGLLRVLRSVGVLPDAHRSMAESGTSEKWFWDRRSLLPRKYVYGKTPELYEKQLNGEGLHPEWRQAIHHCDSPEIIAAHVATCAKRVRVDGGDQLWRLCRMLHNPKRFALLLRIYEECRDPVNEGMSVGSLEACGQLNHSATSEYLKDLCSLGMIRRRRGGRIVAYYPDLRDAKPAIAEICAMIRARMWSGNDNTDYEEVFYVMMNAFRARVVNHLAGGGIGSKEYLCEHFNVLSKNLDRDLEVALQERILDLSSEDETGVYSYVTPADEIARRIVELSW